MMKNRLFFVKAILLFCSFSFFANAQNRKVISTATLKPDGEIELKIVGISENEIVFSDKNNDNLIKLYAAEMQKYYRKLQATSQTKIKISTATLLSDGSQEIQFFDLDGKKKSIILKENENFLERISSSKNEPK